MVEPIKFMFESVFEADDPFADDNGPISFTAGELAAAREESRQAGFEDGVARERATIERRYADALAAIAARLETIAATQAAEIERTVRDAVQLSLAIARKVAPALMRRAPLAEIEALIGEHLAQLIDEPRVVVRLPDALLDEIKTHIDQLAAASGFEGRVILMADQSLADGACRMEWADGGVERDTEAVWREIEAGIARLLDAPAEGSGACLGRPETAAPATSPTEATGSDAEASVSPPVAPSPTE
ncbi:MAG: hypothetical protein ACE5H8_10405 [Alphaproteobacteria bacterium]